MNTFPKTSTSRLLYFGDGLSVACALMENAWFNLLHETNDTCASIHRFAGTRFKRRTGLL